MNSFELELVSGAETQKHKLSLFEVGTRLVLPSLSLVAFIFAQLYSRQPWLSWALLAFTVVLFVSGLYTPIKLVFRRMSDRIKDKRVARNAFPELRKFVGRFEEFIGQQNNTLHYIAQSEVSEGYGQRYASFGIPDMGVWHAFWKHFSDRLDRQRPTMLELQRSLEEFFDLVGTYNNQCVSALFDRMPQTERAALTPQAKSSLNSFQQRYAQFLHECRDFAKDLSTSRPALKGVNFAFSIPKPIS